MVNPGRVKLNISPALRSKGTLNSRYIRALLPKLRTLLAVDSTKLAPEAASTYSEKNRVYGVVIPQPTDFTRKVNESIRGRIPDEGITIPAS